VHFGHVVQRSDRHVAQRGDICSEAGGPVVLGPTDGSSKMRLSRDQAEVWKNLGEADPDWAVLSLDNRRGGKWQSDMYAFYANGERTISEVLAKTAPVDFGKALDFGSGTGRLSFALAERFIEVTAADVSDTMLRELKARAAERRVDNITPLFLEEGVPDADHDFAVSLLTLQHVETSGRLLEAIATISGALKAGGLLYIQVPTQLLGWRMRLQPRWHAFRALRRLGLSPRRLNRLGLSGISMLCVPVRWVTEVLDNNGVELITFDEVSYDRHVQGNYIGRKAVPTE
jgi:SAM-dependent methyltransferase